MEERKEKREKNTRAAQQCDVIAEAIVRSACGLGEQQCEAVLRGVAAELRAQAKLLPPEADGE